MEIIFNEYLIRNDILIFSTYVAAIILIILITVFLVKKELGDKK